MVQKEVAERMQARPKEKEYGALSIAVQYYCDAKLDMIVQPACFMPRPKVASAVITLKVLPERKVKTADEKLFFHLVKCAFGQRRKTLMNCLFHLGNLGFSKEELAELLEEMNPRIWRFIATAQPSISQQAADGMFDERLYRFFSKLSLYIPNLSQSDQDIRKIINLYIIEANARLGRQVVGMDEDAVALIENHPWQYNFSELQNTIYQIMLSAEGPILHHMDVERVLRARDAVHTDSGVATTGTLEEIELRIIEKVLEEENGNVSRAAARLNIGRSTLWRKLKEKNRAE